MTTTINNEHKKLNVPNLRFKEFQGEWSIKSINDLAKVVGGGTPDTSNKLFWDGDIQWFTPSEIGKNKYVDCSLRTISSEGLNNSSAKLLPSNTILLSSRATIGECSISLRECATNQGFQSLISKDCNTEFLYYLVQTKKKDLIRKSCGSTFLEISANEVRKIQASIPSDAEQHKIAKLLSLLDERIATQSKVIEDLKKLKCAIIEDLYCSPKQREPKRRFLEYSSPLSSYRMKDFCERITEKNKDNKCSLVLTIAAQDGLVDQETFFNKSVASENLTGYYILHKGDFAYNRSYSSGYAWGAVKRLDKYEDGVLSTLYICFKINETIVDSDYLSYYFESSKWHKGVSDISGEGARNHGLLNISVTDYFDTEHRFPHIEEQKRIASMLNALTVKEQKAMELEKLYSKQKQYLLRQMFI